MKLLQLISQSQRKRTLKLLQDTKNYLGVDGYLLMRKMLTVSLLIDHLQHIDRHFGYISYEEFLTRNEKAIQYKFDIENLKRINGLKNRSFFIVKSEQVIKAIPTQVQYEVINEWNNRIMNAI